MALIGCAATTPDRELNYKDMANDLEQKQLCIQQSFEDFVVRNNYDIHKMNWDNPYSGIENLCFRNNSPDLHHIFTDSPDPFECNGGICYEYGLKIDRKGNVLGCNENDVSCYRDNPTSKFITKL